MVLTGAFVLKRPLMIMVRYLRVGVVYIIVRLLILRCPLCVCRRMLLSVNMRGRVVPNLVFRPAPLRLNCVVRLLTLW